MENNVTAIAGDINMSIDRVACIAGQLTCLIPIGLDLPNRLAVANVSREQQVPVGSPCKTINSFISRFYSRINHTRFTDISTWRYSDLRRQMSSQNRH